MMMLSKYTTEYYMNNNNNNNNNNNDAKFIKSIFKNLEDAYNKQSTSDFTTTITTAINQITSKQIMELHSMCLYNIRKLTSIQDHLNRVLEFAWFKTVSIDGDIYISVVGEDYEEFTANELNDIINNKWYTTRTDDEYDMMATKTEDKLDTIAYAIDLNTLIKNTIQILKTTKEKHIAYGSSPDSKFTKASIYINKHTTQSKDDTFNTTIPIQKNNNAKSIIIEIKSKIESAKSGVNKQAYASFITLTNNQVKNIYTYNPIQKYNDTITSLTKYASKQERTKRQTILNAINTNQVDKLLYNTKDNSLISIVNKLIKFQNQAMHYDYIVKNVDKLKEIKNIVDKYKYITDTAPLEMEIDIDDYIDNDAIIAEEITVDEVRQVKAMAIKKGYIPNGYNI